MQTLETLMLRLTTNVTVSPASSARSSSAACAHVLDRLGPRLGEQRRQLLGRQRTRRRAPAPIARADEVAADGERRLLAARAAARDEAPVAALDHVEHALGHPLRVDVLRVDAQALGQRDAVGGQALADLVGRRERVLGRDVVAVGAQPAEVGRARRDELAATSRRGWAGSGRRRRACSRRASRRAARMSSIVDRRRPRGRGRARARASRPVRQ